MKIVELDDLLKEGDGKCVNTERRVIVGVDAKRVLVGAGARILFYPTLLYNVFRNKIQSEFRWWDQIDQFLLLGAVPFPSDVPRLKQLGVGGVITLNEPYETLVPSSLYHVDTTFWLYYIKTQNSFSPSSHLCNYSVLQRNGFPHLEDLLYCVEAHGIDHLVIPTRDYLFAPSFVDINRAVDFIHRNASNGLTTYVHCKAGRGRSTTVVLCYLVEYKHMTPSAALEFVRSRRPRVLLAPSQWKAVQEFKQLRVASSPLSSDAVFITKADLEGYHSSSDDSRGKELALVPLIARTQPMIARLSCLFASLKVSGGCGPVTRQLTEARAC